MHGGFFCIDPGVQRKDTLGLQLKFLLILRFRRQFERRVSISPSRSTKSGCLEMLPENPGFSDSRLSIGERVGNDHQFKCLCA